MRPATAADLDALVSLNRVVQALHVKLEPEVFRAEVDVAALRAFFAALIDKPDTGLLIAEIAAEPVGYLWFDRQERPPTVLTQARRRLYVQHLAVRESARRSGVATALLQAVEAEARAGNVTQLVLDAWTRNEEALRFFQGRGFRPFNVVLAKVLE
ncbi:GNAT family N-acetyltransferase [Methylobacterium phyllostachyos]|uniref:GNAT family N-acetyltransferase n=1 Tax=Methylobacterium phyllostachyos TaxID=582672 RepID=UPI0014303A0A|nr:GNAT family N-acetyltransferase [Methylobacterium phyllostachyos]